MNYIESGSIGFTKETYSNVNVYRVFHIFCMHEKTSEEQKIPSGCFDKANVVLVAIDEKILRSF